MTRLCLCWLLLWPSLACGQRVKKHWIALADSRLYVEESGQGPALLDHRMWEKQVVHLCHCFRVLNLDMRKHGLTRDGDSTFANAQAIALLLDSLGVDKVHPLGLSLGAVAATDFVLAYPARVDRLMRASAGLIGYSLDHDSVLVANNRRMALAIQRRDTLAYAEYFVRSWTDGPRREPGQVKADLRAFVKGLVVDKLTHHQWSTGLGFTQKPPPIDRLAAIGVSTLILVGDQDMSDILAIGELLAQRIPQSRRVAGAAHLLNLEQPDRFNRLVKDFLQNRR